ncbi:MAG: cell envelope integrity protein TolA [Nitrosomonadales bacterium]
MSTLTYPYSEPYKFPAGVLALAVHGALFALLYFGINWRSEPPQGMVVDIWEALPAPQGAPVKVELPAAPQVVPEPPVAPPKLAEVVVPPKPDIVLPDKKKSKAVEPKQSVAVTRASGQPKQTVPQVSEAERAQQAASAELERDRAAQAAAIGKMVAEYTARIRSKIKRNIVMPPDVQDDAAAVFDVILIPGGAVLSARLVKSSGNTAYDDAVDRAIAKAQPLPLPPDVALFNQFRVLHFTFRPKETE